MSIRTTVEIDLRTPDAPDIVVQPRGHYTKGGTAHVALSLPDVTIAVTTERAQQLALDLVEALAAVRKPRSVAQETES